MPPKLSWAASAIVCIVKTIVAKAVVAVYVRELALSISFAQTSMIMPAFWADFLRIVTVLDPAHWMHWSVCFVKPSAHDSQSRPCRPSEQHPVPPSLLQVCAV